MSDRLPRASGTRYSATMVTIPFQRLPHGAGLVFDYATDGAAGLDLPAAVADGSPCTIPPWGRAAIPTGLALALPPDHEAQVRPRSGLAARHGITVLNAPGTIDADYRGEITVLLVNLSTEPFTVTRGARIAQLVIAPVVRGTLAEAASLETTVRATSGFGSTGE